MVVKFGGAGPGAPPVRGWEWRQEHRQRWRGYGAVVPLLEALVLAAPCTMAIVSLNP